MSETIAFIGLGNMGVPMAANLVKAGYRVQGFDLSPGGREVAAAMGVGVVETLADCASGASTVITMLPDGKRVITVWTDLMALVATGTLLIDCSTIDVDSARKAHDMAAANSCVSLDAPVSGGIGGASAGTLTFMVGGAVDAFGRGKPILAQMGKKIVPCGEAGAGQVAKICNNMILGVSMAAVGEAFVLGEKLGLSHQALFDVASTSSGQCWSINSYCPVPGPVPTSPANNDYKPGFATTLMLKDLRLAQEAALSSGASTPMGAEAARLYSLFEKLGNGEQDFSGIVNFFRQQSAQG